MPKREGWESRLDVKRKVGQALGLVPRGHDNKGQPYFDLDSKQGLKSILTSVERLLSINKTLRDTADEYAEILKDGGYNFLERKWER